MDVDIPAYLEDDVAAAGGSQYEGSLPCLVAAHQTEGPAAGQAQAQVEVEQQQVVRGLAGRGQRVEIQDGRLGDGLQAGLHPLPPRHRHRRRLQLGSQRWATGGYAQTKKKNVALYLNRG